MHLYFHLYFALGCVWSIQILQVQENSKYFGSSYDTYLISSLSTGWTSSNQYGFSVWTKTPNMGSGWIDYYRVASSLQSYDGRYDGRVLLMSVNSGASDFFQSGMTGNLNGDWSPWNANSDPDSTLIPQNQWVFIAFATDYSANTQNGFRYTLSGTDTQMEFQNRVPGSGDGSFYQLLQTGSIFVGGSPYSTPVCTCYMQYARVYIDYFPNSTDEMINLAIMDAGGTGNLYILYFESDNTINDNSTVPVLVVENSSNTTTTAIKGDTSTAMPILGPYNTLNCRSISILSLDSGSSTTNGMVIAMDINPLDPATANQVIFSLRDSSTNEVSLAFRFQPPSNTDLITNYGSGWSAPIAGPSLTPNTWNRLVVEIVQGQPTGFGVGFSTFRAWVGGIEISRVPVGDFSSSEIPIPDMSEATLDLCSQKSYGTLDSVDGFNGDILNLLWYRGVDVLNANASDPSCLLSGFLLDPNQQACLQCNSGYYFYDMTCVSSCPDGYYTHQGTKSCLKCHYPGQHFDSNGFCAPCNSAGQILIQGICQECDTGCVNCSGTQSNCSSCSSGYYLQPSSTTCLSTCPNEYYPDSNSNSCLFCAIGCSNCTGGSNTQCSSCSSGYYLQPNSTNCSDFCPSNGYYPNTETNTCSTCDPSCATCLGGSNTQCSSCSSGYFLNSGACLECDDTCTTCNQTGPSGCTSCEYPRELINNSCPVTYLSLASLQTLGKVMNVCTQTLIATSSILPAVTGGLSTTAFLLVDFVAEFDLYKYINVPFPENFVTFCEQTDASAIPNIFAGIDTVNRGDNPSSTIGKFQFWGVSVVLIDKSYISIFKELIALGIILLLNILVFIFRRNQKLRSILLEIRTLFMWNVFLSYFLGDFSELQLYSMIQMRENYVSSAYADFSLALAIIIVVAYSGLFPYMVYILNRRRLHQEEIRNDNIVNKKESNAKATLENKQLERWAEVPDHIKIIAEDFHERNRFTRNFMLVMLLQMILLVFLVFFFQDYGLAQAIIYTVFTLIFVCLIARQRPFKSRLQRSILLLNQSTKIVMGIMAIIFGANEKTQSISPYVIAQMGYSLIVLLLIVVGINLIISIAQIFVSIYKKIKQLKSKGKISDLEILKKNGKNEESCKDGSSPFSSNRRPQLEDNLIFLSDNPEEHKNQYDEKQISIERISTLVNPKKIFINEHERGVNDQPTPPSKAGRSPDEGQRNQSEIRRSRSNSPKSSLGQRNSIQIVDFDALTQMIDLSHQPINTNSQRIHPERSSIKLKGHSTFRTKNTNLSSQNSPGKINLG